MQKNSDILEIIMDNAICDNPNQLAKYLTDKYGITITRQQVSQFKKSDRLTITHLLLREAIEMAISNTE